MEYSNIFSLNLGLVETSEAETEKVEKVELVFGSAQKIFNHCDDINHYLFSMCSENDGATVVYVKIYNPLMNFEASIRPRKQTNKFLEFEIIKYSNGKGPPRI